MMSTVSGRNGREKKQGKPTGNPRVSAPTPPAFSLTVPGGLAISTAEGCRFVDLNLLRDAREAHAEIGRILRSFRSSR